MSKNIYQVSSTKTVEQAVNDLDATVKDHKFGVLHSYNFMAIFASKGIEFKTPCQVLEICNPMKAKHVLEIDMALSNALPCRLAVYQDAEGVTQISMIKPGAILSLLNQDAALQALAAEVETVMISMINQAK